MINACLKLRFSVTELPDGKSVDIAPGFRVTCGKVPFYDSWLAIQSEGKCLLNMNDCVILRPAVMQTLKRRFGNVDVLLQQFSYASWVANEDQPEAWKDFIALNREMAATCPPITDRREPLARRPAGS